MRTGWLGPAALSPGLPGGSNPLAVHSPAAGTQGSCQALGWLWHMSGTRVFLCARGLGVCGAIVRSVGVRHRSAAGGDGPAAVTDSTLSEGGEETAAAHQRMCWGGEGREKRGKRSRSFLAAA